MTEEREFSFSLSEEQNIMKETIAKFIKGHINGNVHSMDEERNIPPEIIQKIWDPGNVLSVIPEEYGGYGMEYSPVMNTIILEELATGGMAVAIHALLPSLFLYPILEMGTEDQKKKYITHCCGSEFTPCTAALVEPRFGFDPLSMKTSTEKINCAWILNGEKCFMPLAGESEYLLVAAMADGKPELFIVSTGMEGVSIGEREKNPGLYSLPTYRVSFDNCGVPAEDRLGGDQGCDFDRFLQKSRVALSALATGLSRASFEYTRDYAKEREQFGEIIASRQSVAFMIAEMAYEVDAMRLLTWKAASALEAGHDARRESYLAKLYAGDMAMKITD